MRAVLDHALWPLTSTWCSNAHLAMAWCYMQAFAQSFKISHFVCPGLAHLLEHMAFKGTPRIGTTDFKKEAPLLDACDEGELLIRQCKHKCEEWHENLSVAS